MTKRARVFLQSTLLATVMAGLFVPDASAGQVTTTFGGTVTGPGTGVSLPSTLGTPSYPVQVGDTISGYFTYTVPVSGSGPYSFAGTGQTLLFSIPVNNGNSTFSGQNSNSGTLDLYKITVTGTGKGATLDLSVDMINTYGKTAGATCDLKFTSISATYAGGLPASSTAFSSDFGTTGKFNWDPGGSGIGGIINNINGQSVPEPSSFILMSVAMATLGMGLAISRRKLARA
jgi:hypothetical protein